MFSFFSFPTLFLLLRTILFFPKSQSFFGPSLLSLWLIVGLNLRLFFLHAERRSMKCGVMKPPIMTFATPLDATTLVLTFVCKVVLPETVYAGSRLHYSLEGNLARYSFHGTFEGKMLTLTDDAESVILFVSLFLCISHCEEVVQSLDLSIPLEPWFFFVMLG